MKPKFALSDYSKMITYKNPSLPEDYMWNARVSLIYLLQRLGVIGIKH